MPDPTSRPGRPRTNVPTGPAAQIGEQIRTRRLALGLSQDALAREAQVSVDTLSNYERGKYSPPLDVARRIAVVLQCSLDELG